jgi:hypothetical protein
MPVHGPVSGGSHGWPFGVPTADLGAFGYRQEEYFLEGEADRYVPVPGSELGWDGSWAVEPAGVTAPFRTRVVVIRPDDPASFNGTVLVLWNNVSAGYENFGGGDSAEVYEEGYAIAAVSAQKVGVHGAGDDPQGLCAWDPERYGSLTIPGDDYSFDIFTQAARAVSPARPREGPDPMGGLEVRRLVAMGASQSAARLATYLNAVQPAVGGPFDAFFLIEYFGGGTPLEVGDTVMTVQASSEGAPRIAEGTHLLRDDLGVPVMVVNTECESTSCFPVRQPDTDGHRYWEIAGSSHVSLQGMVSSAPRMERDFGFSIPLKALGSVNQVSPAPVVDAALHHLQAWLTEGTPPPVQPLIEYVGEPPEIRRDDHGIACGGVRLPTVEVPVAHNSAIQQAPDVFSRLLGFHEPFPVEEVRALYGTRELYLELFEKATLAAEAASVILPRDVGPLMAEARSICPL